MHAMSQATLLDSKVLFLVIILKPYRLHHSYVGIYVEKGLRLGIA